MIKKNIPNAITCGNLLCGCLAITSAFHGNLVWAAYLVGIAAALDFLDGLVARLLCVHSEIGKQLDSLADMVTFGVVPGVIMFKLLNISLFQFGEDIDFATSVLPGWHTTIAPSGITGSAIVPFIAFLIPIFSAIRLAKFNIDLRQTDSFIGVPTPANSILIASFPLILGIYNTSIYTAQKYFSWHLGEYISDSGKIEAIGDESNGWTLYPPLSGLGTDEFTIHSYEPTIIEIVLLNPWFLIGITLIMSFLLVAELPLFALKFKHFKWKGNEVRYLFLILTVALLILFQFTAIPFIIFLYIILSVINNIGKKRKEQDYDLIAKQ